MWKKLNPTAKEIIISIVVTAGIWVFLYTYATPICNYFLGSLSAEVVASPVIIEEEDGSPRKVPTRIKFANGALTDNGDGSVSVLSTGTGDMTKAVEGVAIAADTTTLANTKANIASPTFTGVVSADSMTITNTATAGAFVATKAGQSAINAGMIINEDGGSAATDDLRAETDNNANALVVDASADKVYLGDTTNGVSVSTAGVMAFIGTSSGTVISGGAWTCSFKVSYPSATYTNEGSSQTVVACTPYAVLIDSIAVVCDANPTTEIVGDLMYCDSAIAYTNPVLLNAINTTDGVCKDNTMTVQALPANKKLYVVFHSQPEAAMKSIAFTLKGKHQ